MGCRATGEPVWVRRQREWGKAWAGDFIMVSVGKTRRSRRVGLGSAVLNNFGGL